MRKLKIDQKAGEKCSPSRYSSSDIHQTGHIRSITDGYTLLKFVICMGLLMFLELVTDTVHPISAVLKHITFITPEHQIPPVRMSVR